MTASRDLYVNGRIFTADGRAWASALLVEGDRIIYAGDAGTARRIGSTGRETDLGGALVVPGFIDGHAHVLSTGQAAEEVNLVSAADLTQIQRRLADWASKHPGQRQLRARGWLHSSVPGGHPDRQMMDAAVSDRAVYAFANDFHSVWLNTAALAEAGITAQTPDPPGGKIVRDRASGEPTGHIDETAMHRLVVPFLEADSTDDDRDRYLAQALAGYRASAVTGVTDMALDTASLMAMSRAEKAGTLTARIAAHWMVRRDEDPAANLAQVAKAAELAARYRSPFLRITGIKVVIDGTVDGCTASLGEPYADGSLPGPIWDLAALEPVVTAADAAGLQVAMHAIGDEAIRIAIGAVEAAVRVNGPRQRRHRIEHLEVITEAEIARLAALGIVASMQPVHADPAIQANWRAMLGDDRVGRGYPWPEMTQAGAVLAFGTDSPTAPSEPLPNLFVAATRRSAFDPALAPNVARYAVPLIAAVGHATRDAAWACRAENDQGRLAGGLLADFAVIDRDVFTEDPAQLLEARVLRTVVGGRTVYQAAG